MSEEERVEFIRTSIISFKPCASDIRWVLRASLRRLMNQVHGIQ